MRDVPRLGTDPTPTIGSLTIGSLSQAKPDHRISEPSQAKPRCTLKQGMSTLKQAVQISRVRKTVGLHTRVDSGAGTDKGSTEIRTEVHGWCGPMCECDSAFRLL